MKSGLSKVRPHRQDYSFLHTFGAVGFDPKGLPEDFSLLNNQVIPNQNAQDTRFNPPLPPMPYGCTGESTTFACGLEDSATYDPQWTYLMTPPHDQGGRDIRESLQSAISQGLKDGNGVIGNKRTAYFNVYGAGKIDDFDAARIALWINQGEKRAVSVGSYWYPEFERPDADGILPTPSFNTSEASGHNHLITGWKTINGVPYLEDLSWQGQTFAKNGRAYFSREVYNALMAQPWTGAFTITKTAGQSPIPLGFQVYIDHLVYFIRSLWNFNTSGDIPNLTLYNIAKDNLGKHLTLDSSVPAEIGCAEAVSACIKEAGIPIASTGIAGTAELAAWLKQNPRFEQIGGPEQGCILVSPTGSGNGTVRGHTGILGALNKMYVNDYGICSNDSQSGLFLELWCLSDWKRYYNLKGGLPMLYFRFKGQLNNQPK